MLDHRAIGGSAALAGARIPAARGPCSLLTPPPPFPASRIDARAVGGSAALADATPPFASL
ncbi:MAG: hypothetical protein COW56_06485, partial [Rhodocyclales bacterium CG17_big_fil_post_rev_8_21_14_2_50_68_7]